MRWISRSATTASVSSPSTWRQIFERYSRIETPATQNIQGTGLGLTIARQIVQLYGGKVWATSESGQGSVFHVQLPLDT